MSYEVQMSHSESYESYRIIRVILSHSESYESYDSPWLVWLSVTQYDSYNSYDSVWIIWLSMTHMTHMTQYDSVWLILKIPESQNLGNPKSGKLKIRETQNHKSQTPTATKHVSRGWRPMTCSLATGIRGLAVACPIILSEKFCSADCWAMGPASIYIINSPLANVVSIVIDIWVSVALFRDWNQFYDSKLLQTNYTLRMLK